VVVNGVIAYTRAVGTPIENIGDGISLYARNGYVGTYSLRLDSSAKVYGRVLFDNKLKGVEDMSPYLIPTEDIVENNRNYRYCRGYNEINIQTTSDASEEATQWGRRPDNLYYTEPVSSVETGTSGLWAPIGKTRWNYYSIWVPQNNWIAEADEENYRATACADHAQTSVRYVARRAALLLVHRRQ